MVDSHVGVFKPLVVIAKAESIFLKSSNLEHSEASVYHENEKVSFHEGDRRHFSCVINKTHPIPAVAIKLGSSDISDKFEKAIKLTRKLSPNHHHSKSFISELFYDVSLSAANLEISHEFDLKQLSCLVNYPGGLYKEMTSIMIDLHGYKPKFICEGGELEEQDGKKDQYYQALLHQSMFTIKCKVIGFPAAENVTVKWKKVGGVEIVLADGDKRGNHRFSVEDDDKDKNAKELTFRITILFPQNFRTYTLKASNSLGDTQHWIHLNQINVAALVSSSESNRNMATPIRILLPTMMAFLWFY